MKRLLMHLVISIAIAFVVNYLYYNYLRPSGTADTILEGLNKLDDDSPAHYILSKNTRHESQCEWIWEFEIRINGMTKTTAIDHSQFMDERLQNKLKAIGIGYEKGMIGGALALPNQISETKLPFGTKLIHCKIWADGTATTDIPGVFLNLSGFDAV